VFESEDHWLDEKHPAGLFVDGGSDYMRVDRQALLVVARPVNFHLQSGVLSGQEGSQVFIKNEHHLDLSCTWRRRETHKGEEKESERKSQQKKGTFKKEDADRTKERREEE